MANFFNKKSERGADAEEALRSNESFRAPATEHEKIETIAETPPHQERAQTPRVDTGETSTPSPVPNVQTTISPPSQKSPQLQRIESVLEEDLKDYFYQMDEGHRKVFRIEGERTAQQIDALVSSAKATAKRVLYLIQRWLRLIPGINKFFLEQEAKIKTDKIMHIIEDK